MKSDWKYYIFFLVIVFILLYKYITINFNYWKKRNVYYIEPVPFFGSILPIFRMKKHMAEWLRDLCRNVDKDYFGIFVFHRPVLVVKCPKLIKSILQKDFPHFQNRSVMQPVNDPLMSNIMFFSKGPHWKTVRSKVSPVFTTGKLKLMFSLILNECNDMIDYITNIENIPNVETKEISSKYSTNVIARCAFAVNAQSFQNPNAEFRAIGRKLFDFRYSTALRQLGAWFLPNIIKTFNIRFFDKDALDQLQNIFKDVLHSRMASTSVKGNDLVDILLEVKKKDTANDYSETALLAQAIQFFVAGFETVSSTLCFTLYELCIQPNIQNKLRAEIMENIEKLGGITYEGMTEMKYLDMCVSESLRKYPVLPFLDRVCNTTYKVEESDLVIEKGTIVYIPMFELHYNPKIFPNPEKYDPERFANKNAINSDGLSYIPFGDGPRICIGNRFGLMAVKFGLITILSKFKLEATDKTPVSLIFEPKSFLLQSTVGVPLKFVPLSNK